MPPRTSLTVIGPSHIAISQLSRDEIATPRPWHVALLALNQKARPIVTLHESGLPPYAAHMIYPYLFQCNCSLDRLDSESTAPPSLPQVSGFRSRGLWGRISGGRCTSRQQTSAQRADWLGPGNCRDAGEFRDGLVDAQVGLIGQSY